MRRRFRWLGALVAVLALLTAGCSDDDDGGTDDTEAPAETSTTAAPESTTTTTPVEAAALDLSATEFAYDSGGVTEIPSGRVTVTLTNDGILEHQATITRFKEGRSLADLANMGEDLSQLDDILDTFGGPNAASAGSSVVSTVNLEPGSYVVMCFIPDPTDGQPHVAKGQLLPIEVTDSGTEAPPLPATDETVTLDDFEFGLPDGFTGSGQVTVENAGTQAHELTVYRAADGATADDVATYLTTDPSTGATVPPGPPPIDGSTGATAMNPGQSNVVQLDLTPGEYLFICFIPDAETGAPHFTEGMVRTVTIE